MSAHLAGELTLTTFSSQTITLMWILYLALNMQYRINKTEMIMDQRKIRVTSQKEKVGNGLIWQCKKKELHTSYIGLS